MMWSLVMHVHWGDYVPLCKPVLHCPLYFFLSITETYIHTGVGLKDRQLLTQSVELRREQPQCGRTGTTGRSTDRSESTWTAEERNRRRELRQINDGVFFVVYICNSMYVQNKSCSFSFRLKTVGKFWVLGCYELPFISI